MQQPEPRDDRDQDAEDRAWQSIVDNYGARAEIDDPPSAPPSAALPAPPSDVPFGGRFGDPRALSGEDADDPFVGRLDDAEEEGYRPPEPPPLPRLSPDRAIAWAGVFGSPVVLLVALLFSISLPSWLGYLLIIGFVGGFVYLVARMPREPRDPWDDGAQI